MFSRQESIEAKGVRMSEDRKKMAPQAAFIAIGIMFIVIGINSSRGLIAAGIVFLIAAFIQHRKSQNSGDGRESKR